VQKLKQIISTYINSLKAYQNNVVCLFLFSINGYLAIFEKSQLFSNGNLPIYEKRNKKEIRLILKPT
jgi:uncharacterized ion transporter superfamily protein YfcC